MAHNTIRWNDLHAPQIVGDLHQGGDEQFVTAHTFGQKLFAGHFAVEIFGDETALGAHRHNHSVLHLLCLGQAQNLSPEIFRPVRPAQAATSNRSAAQVNAFHIWSVNENFAIRARLRQLID